MGFQSKTYSLSDEVVAAIEAARAQGETPNRFLRRVLQIPDPPSVTLEIQDLHVGSSIESPQLTETPRRAPRQKGDKTR